MEFRNIGELLKATQDGRIDPNTLKVVLDNDGAFFCRRL